jgi:hypothetical protein
MKINTPMSSHVYEFPHGYILKVKKEAKNPDLEYSMRRHCKKEYQKLTLISRILETYQENQAAQEVSVRSPIPIAVIEHTDDLHGFEKAPALLMTQVPGQEILLYSQLDDLKEKQTIYNNYAIALGKAFQILSEQKLIHGDFRPRHTFYDHEKKIMSIIDVESLAICGAGFQTNSQNKLTTEDILSNLKNLHSYVRDNFTKQELIRFLKETNVSFDKSDFNIAKTGSDELELLDKIYKDKDYGYQRLQLIENILNNPKIPNLANIKKFIASQEASITLWIKFFLCYHKKNNWNMNPRFYNILKLESIVTFLKDFYHI